MAWGSEVLLCLRALEEILQPSDLQLGGINCRIRAPSTRAIDPISAAPPNDP